MVGRFVIWRLVRPTLQLTQDFDRELGARGDGLRHQDIGGVLPKRCLKRCQFKIGDGSTRMGVTDHNLSTQFTNRVHNVMI
jgi:hypothetical protein